ncbi:MAG: hypothetical protein ACYC0V_06805 [Armatimonadota bacterium]
MKAGYAKIEITPEWQTELAGYGYYLERVFTGVHDPLWARAIAFESDGVSSLLISCDLVGLGEPLVTQVKSEISQTAGISVESIMLHSTHTHSGPAAAHLRGCGRMDQRYVDWLHIKIRQVGIDAFSNMEDVESMHWSEVPIDGIGFNRVYGDPGPIDPNVRVLTIRRIDARPVMIVNYACHPVSNGTNDMVSADFPGRVMAVIEENVIDPLYITGFCGDIDPPVQRDYRTMEKHGERIARVALESIDSSIEISYDKLKFGIRPIKLPYDVPSRNDLLKTLDDAVSCLEKDPSDKVALVTISWVRDALLDLQKSDMRTYIETYVQTLMIGELCIIGFPGEVFTQFGLDLRKRNPGIKLMTANTSNAPIGYIPTADEFDRQGYASHAAARIYDTYTFHKGFGEEITEESSNLISIMIDNQ